jgi:hypothetical protein
MTHDVERVLADIDADHGDRCVEFLRHGVLLVLSAPCQLLVLAGPEHGRTIPSADLSDRTKPRRLDKAHNAQFRLRCRAICRDPAKVVRFCIATHGYSEDYITGRPCLLALRLLCDVSQSVAFWHNSDVLSDRV